MSENIEKAEGAGRAIITFSRGWQTLVATRSLGRHGVEVITGDEYAMTAASFSRYSVAEFRYPNPTKEPEAFLDALEKVVIEPTDEKITFEEALSTARTHRKDLASLDYLSEAAAEQRTAARSGLFPSLSASASYSFWDVAFPRSLRDVDKIDGVSYGLTLRIPIFDRWQTRSAIDRAKISLRQSREQQKSVRRGIALEIRNAFYIEPFQAK